MKKLIPLLVASVLAAYSNAGATTVIPPSFDELVDRAETILQGTVTEVKPQWTGEGADRHIVSYITFKVEEALKGNPGQSYTLRMFGGEIEGEGMAIADAPQFQVGDEEIVFIENNGSQAIPLVGMMFGRFHVRPDGTGPAVVTTNEDKPVKSVANLGLGHEADAVAATNAANLSAADFKAAVKKHLESKTDNHPTQ
jgi:hypothetical protein